MPELTIRPLHAALGAEISGVNLADPLDEATFGAVHQAWMEHLVLVFPKQDLTDVQHTAFARRFGDLEVHHQDIIKSHSSPEIFRLSNVDDAGNLLAADHTSIAQISLAQRWHTDSSFREVPSMGSILHGIEVTDEGGVTCFTNMYKVFEALDETTRARITGRGARHDFGHLAKLGPVKPLTEAERKAMPPVWQPMARQHPVTNRTSLFISPIYNDAVEGMEEAEAMALLAQLTELSSREDFVYRHVWSADDIVMWDNRCTMHRRDSFDESLRRLMHRTQLKGCRPQAAA
ncbi:MAG: TauD/TfdA family dioxygenase [Alphaproteobacteria bacterium]